MRPSRLPLSQVAVGKASKAPGNETAGLEGPRGTRGSAGDRSLTDPKAQGHLQSNQLPSAGGAGGSGVPGRTLRETSTADPHR